MTLRYRRNIGCLGTEALHDLREALQRMFDLPEDHPESWAVLGGIHGSPAPNWCDHGTPGFLTWHRAYMLAFENALRANGCTTALPFWDWSSGPTTGVPVACREPTYVDRQGDTVPNPLYAGPIATAAGGGTTQRRADIDTTTYGDIAMSAQAAMGNGTFASFQSSLNGPHGSVHIRTGGQMSNASLAGFDPLFFLHHCNVDRLWWQWQQAHPGTGIPATEAVHPLDPFPRPFDDDWMTGADVVDADELGYGYSTWCFFIPPIIVWELIPIELPIPVTRLLREARVVVRASSMPAASTELRIFIGDEKAVADDGIDRNPAFAGTIGLFGTGERHTGQDRMAGALDVSLDVTDHLRTACRTEHEDAGGEHDHHTAADGHHGSTRKLALRVVAFDADGRPLRDTTGIVDGIELVIE